MPIRKYLVATGYLLLLLLSLGLLAYGWMMRQFSSAQVAFRQGDTQRALERYGRAENPFTKLPGLAALFREEYKQANLNQVSILYGQNQNQEALAKLEQLPVYAPALAESSDYAFWMGNLLFRQAVESKNPEASMTALKAALSEYQKGLAAEPDDWDLKFNYELVRQIFAQQGRSREKQEQKVKTIIDKMRPPDPSQQQLAPEKRG